ncbi:hypothetical protein U0070_025783 [Myodes glareolus]|uniref:Uncharacterized protein n=1 Tax=Myodes glareolus TaxID=447135 RepID=A0AAW0J9V9_MYOGA
MARSRGDTSTPGGARAVSNPPPPETFVPAALPPAHVNTTDDSGSTLSCSQACVASNHFADHLLAEAVAHEEHRVFRNIGNQGRTGTLVEATEAHLGVGLQATVGE